MADSNARSIQDVFLNHLHWKQQKDLERDLISNYDENVVVFCADGLHYGHDGVRQTAGKLRCYLPNTTFDYQVTLVAGEMAYLEWSVHRNGERIEDGADSFLIRDGQIIAQTIHYNTAHETHP